jgi:hypothetical protein
MGSITVGGHLSHLKRTHGLTVREVYGNTCPVCGVEAGGTHIGRMHPEVSGGMAAAFAWARANGDPHGVVAAHDWPA